MEGIVKFIITPSNKLTNLFYQRMYFTIDNRVEVIDKQHQFSHRKSSDYNLDMVKLFIMPIIINEDNEVVLSPLKMTDEFLEKIKYKQGKRINF